MKLILSLFLLLTFNLQAQVWFASNATVRAMNVVGVDAPAVYATYFTNQTAITNILAGASNSPRGLISVWFNADATINNNASHMLDIGTFSFQFMNPEVGIYVRNANGDVVEWLYVNGTPTKNTWHHFLASWDLSQADAEPNRVIYYDGVKDYSRLYHVANDTNAFTGMSVIGSATNDAAYFEGALSQVYFTTPDTFFDITIQANREKFMKDGRPVDLGADGSLPTGTKPLVYLKGDYLSFTNNSGSGGNYYLRSGSLTNFPTRP